MSTAWIPVVTAHSLDGFIVGALTAGACFLLITVPRRARKRAATEDGPPARMREGRHALGSGGFDDTDVGGLAELGLADAQPWPGDSPELAETVPDLPELPPQPAPPRSVRRPDLTAVWAPPPPDDEPPPDHEEPPDPGEGPDPGQGPVPYVPAPRGRRGRGGSHRAGGVLGDPTLTSTAGMPAPPGARRPPRHAAP